MNFCTSALAGAAITNATATKPKRYARISRLRTEALHCRGRRRSAQRLCREPEMHHVAVRDDVLLAFQPHFARAARAGFATGRNVIVVGDRLRADKAFLEIRMDHAGRLRRLGAFGGGTRPRLLRAGSEIRDEM